MVQEADVDPEEAGMAGSLTSAFRQVWDPWGLKAVVSYWYALMVDLEKLLKIWDQMTVALALLKQELLRRSGDRSESLASCVILERSE